jgi:hypothetical protein
LSDCWLWCASKDAAGYGAISVDVDGKRTSLRAHRLSYELTKGPIPVGLMACHKCDNPPCVNPDHIFLGTAQENSADRDAKGRHRVVPPRNRAIGERSGQAKLTDADVLRISERYADGATQKQLASEFGISQTEVGNILRGRSWKHVQRPLFRIGRGRYKSNGEHQRKAGEVARASRRSRPERQRSPEPRLIDAIAGVVDANGSGVTRARDVFEALGRRWPLRSIKTAIAKLATAGRVMRTDRGGYTAAIRSPVADARTEALA